MYTGEYRHALDPKGRLIVPYKFRSELGSSFVITRGYEGCLCIYDNKNWTEFTDKLKALPYSSKDTRDIVRFFLGKAIIAEPDKQGRVLLPENLRKLAGIENGQDVVFQGCLDRIEIWSAARFDQEDEDNTEERISRISENLSRNGITF